MKNGTGNNEHLDERTIELFVNESRLVADRRAEIARHLKMCAGCAAMQKEVAAYYAEVDKVQKEQSEKASHALYAPDRAIRPQRYDLSRESVPQKLGLSLRIVRSVRQYPVRWSGGFALIILAAVLLLPRLVQYDRNPAYAQSKDESLVVYNKAGDELWRKRIGVGYDLKSSPDWIAGHPQQALTTYDVDGDGRNEVLAIFGWMNSRAPDAPSPNLIVCYNADGSERWRHEVHRHIVIGDVEYSDDYRVHQMLIGDFNRDKKPELVVAASHSPWFPNVIIRLNAIDGSFVSEYWHPGVVPNFEHKDIDGDGVEELVFSGQNNRFGRACLIVLDPTKIEGYAPTPKEYVPQGVPNGLEEYYLLFPPTDLELTWLDVANQVIKMTYRSDGLLEVGVLELIDKYKAEMYYYFDSTMTCVRVRASDHFTAAHKMLVENGMLKQPLSEKYLDRLRREIMYWDGEKFVDRPTRSSQYNRLAKK